jgi:tetratricopeptide (TPR) repeat protein
MNIDNLIIKANEEFELKSYQFAMLHFADVLILDPDNKEARIGAMLTELAMSGEDGALVLFDYYGILKNNNTENAESIIEDMLETIEDSSDNVETLVKDTLVETIELQDGITYDDFKMLIGERGNFRQVFEDIIFSTKIIITSRDDFLDFLSGLIDANFIDMALNYMESAIKSYPNDKKLLALFQKLQKRDFLENTTTRH